MQDSIDQKIEAYLLGKLRGEELAAFKARLKSDAQLAEEVKTRKLLIRQVESLGALEMKNRLVAIKDQMQQRRRKVIRRMLGLAGAAAIALLFFALPLFQTPDSPRDLYEKYHEAYQLPFTSRNTTNQNPILDQAGTYYLAGDYTNALPLLEQLLSEKPSDSRTRLALGICQQKLELQEAALQTFAPLIEKQDALYLDQARWYSALAYLQLEQTEACRQQLIALSANPRAVHYEQAKELLGALPAK